MQINFRTMFMLVVMTEVYPDQQEFLEQHTQEGGQLQRTRSWGNCPAAWGIH